MALYVVWLMAFSMGSTADAKRPAHAGPKGPRGANESTTTTTQLATTTSTTKPPTTTTSTTTTTTTSTTTTTTTPPNQPSNPSGQAMPVGDIPGWRQVFTDDFTTNVARGSFPDAVSSRWGAYGEGWSDTSRNGTYSPHRVLSVQSGVLDWWIHTENGAHLVSVPFPKIPGASSENGLTSGRYVVRFRADPLHGYKTAWLLWPDSGVWPRDGEIDFPEGDLDRSISGFVHYQNGTFGGDQAAFGTSASYSQWHTAVIEWVSGTRVSFYLDGNLVGTTTNRVPNTPMHWVLQTETTLDGFEPADSVQGHVQVDWVAVYRPA